MGNADGEQHGGVDFSRERAFFFPVQILSADSDIRALGCSDGGIEAEIGGADDDFVAVVIFDQREEIAEEVTGLVGRFVHLPVGSDDFFSHERPFSNLKIAEFASGCWDNSSAART